MKCAHPACNRGIGLVSHRRGWFGSRLYCSRACRDRAASEPRRPRRPQSSGPSAIERLFAVSRAAKPAGMLDIR
jgi:hypothetical protein